MGSFNVGDRAFVDSWLHTTATFGELITYQGQSLTALVYRIMTERIDLETNSAELRNSVHVRIRKTDVATPTIGQTFVVDSKTYRVERIYGNDATGFTAEGLRIENESVQKSGLLEVQR